MKLPKPKGIIKGEKTKCVGNKAHKLYNNEFRVAREKEE